MIREPLKTITEEQAFEIAKRFGTPTHVTSQKVLEKNASEVLAFPNAFRLKVRYAMKADPDANIISLFHSMGIGIDASSGYEAQRAIAAGIPPNEILLTSQQISENTIDLIARGVEFNACSLRQLDFFGSAFPGHDVSVRINPGRGSGGTRRTNTGGPSSSFGIWYEQIPEILNVAREYDLKIKRVHTHIGSGSDPKVWQRVARKSLACVEQLIEAEHPVETLNLGGGFKRGRMSYERTTDLQECGMPVADAFKNFARKTGKKLKLEIEPGTFLVANAGCVVSSIIDIKRTPDYNFIIVDTGMTEVLRPVLYGAQHPLVVIPQRKETRRYIVSGHECESGSMFTPAPGNPERLQPRLLGKAMIGDLLVIEDTGAYCDSMSTVDYNSFPRAARAWIDDRGDIKQIRVRQSLTSIVF